jgi:hypothetical protein
VYLHIYSGASLFVTHTTCEKGGVNYNSTSENFNPQGSKKDQRMLLVSDEYKVLWSKAWCKYLCMTTDSVLVLFSLF